MNAVPSLALCAVVTTGFACGDADHPAYQVPTGVPATISNFDADLRVGEPDTISVSWETVDYAHPQNCNLILIVVTCYPTTPYPFVVKSLSCENCTIIDPPDDEMPFDGFGQFRVVATTPGPVRVLATIEHLYSDEVRELSLSSFAE